MIYRKIRRLFALVFSLALATALLSDHLPPVSAVGNHLDRTFSGDGVSTIDFSTNSFATDVAIQANGKIVVAGTNETDFAVARLDTDGSLDTTFDGDGRVVTPVLGDGKANAVAIQPDGKIIVAGQAVMNGNPQFVLVRYNTNGSLDTTFDGNGFVYTLIEPFSATNISEAVDVTVQPNGKIVAVGYVRGTNVAGGPSFCDWAIVRYNANGSLDTTFSGDGKVTTDFGGNTSIETASAVVISTDNKILAGGASVPVNTQDFALARYNTNGSLDTTFNGSGKLSVDFGYSEKISDVKLQPDGKIVAAGYSVLDAGVVRHALARFNAVGALDTSFDGDGKVLSGFNTGFLEEIALQPDGKIVTVETLGGFRLTRRNSDGSIDAGFGRAGIVNTPINGSYSANFFAIAIQTDGKLVAAGNLRTDNDPNSESDFAVVRYLPDMGKPFDFDNDGKTDISIFRPSVGQWWYYRSSDGGNYAAQFGASTDKLVPGDYTGDGRSDIAIWRPSIGEWFILRSEDGSYYSYPFGASGDISAVADFDGDGKADSAVFRPSDTTWYIRRSSDGGFTIQQFGTSGDVPVPADYDGDGKSDVAVWRASAGQWWIQRSTAGTIAFTFGNSADKPIQGDYTGDGRADVAIFRPVTGEWFILRSESFSYYSFPFGTNGDVPAPGDYDGDGKFDATVFRPSNSTWYVQRTTAGTLIQNFGIAGDKPVPNAFVP